jgi:hypothetical protein
MSNSAIDRIDQELSSSTVVRSGMSTYATILKRYERLAKRDRTAADRQLEEAIVDLAAACRSALGSHRSQSPADCLPRPSPARCSTARTRRPPEPAPAKAGGMMRDSSSVRLT